MKTLLGVLSDYTVTIPFNPFARISTTNTDTTHDNQNHPIPTARFTINPRTK